MAIGGINNDLEPALLLLSPYTTNRSPTIIKTIGNNTKCNNSPTIVSKKTISVFKTTKAGIVTEPSKEGHSEYIEKK